MLLAKVFLTTRSRSYNPCRVVIDWPYAHLLLRVTDRPTTLLCSTRGDVSIRGITMFPLSEAGLLLGSRPQRVINLVKENWSTLPLLSI